MKYSKAAQAAKAIKEKLKDTFPKTKFKVNSQVFDEGNAVRIVWYNGPLEDAVKSTIKDFQSGYFDPVTNQFIYSNRKRNIPQTEYISTCRLMTNFIEDVIVDLLHRRHPECMGIDRDGFIDEFNKSMRQLIWEQFRKMDLSH